MNSAEVWMLITSGFLVKADMRAAKCEMFYSSAVIAAMV